MREKLTAWVLQRPKLIFVLVLLLTLGTAALIPMIQIDTDPENMLPTGQPQRVFHNQVKAQFNLHDMIVVGAVNTGPQGIYNPASLRSLVDITSQVMRIEGVIDYDVLSLSTVDNITAEAPGSIQFEWLMRQAPKDAATAQVIAQQVEHLPLLANTLVSADHQAASIYVPIKDKNESHRIAQQIQTIIDEQDSDDAYHITGLPVAEDTFGYQMFVQMGISAPLAGLMIFVLLWVFFRNLKFIAAPMIVAMATVITVMGVMIGMGFTVHIMSSMIAIFLMPIAVVDSIHIMSEFVENYDAKAERQEVIRQVIADLFKPMLFTSLTSAAGFFSLLLTPIPPVQIFGAFVGAGILLAFVLTMLFIPAYLGVLKNSSLHSLHSIHHAQSKMGQWVKAMGLGSIRHHRLVILGFAVVLLFSLWGIKQIQINDNPVRWFKSDHPIRIADQVLNQHFAGTYDAYLVLQSNQGAARPALQQRLTAAQNALLTAADIKDTADDLTYLNEALLWAEDRLFDVGEADAAQYEFIVEQIEQLQAQRATFKSPQQLAYVAALQASLQQSGLVGKSNSLADVVKTVNRALTQGDYVLPASAAGVAQTLLQYQSSHRPQDLWHFVAADYSKTVIWLQLKQGDNQDMTAVVDWVDAFVQAQPPAAGISVHWAGKTFLNKVWQEQMVAGMGKSLISAFVVVLVMMVLLFRSLVFGLLAMLPLSLTIAFIYGLIGWLGKDYDMPIAVLSALTLGLSVDFAIHFLQRARDIYAEQQDFRQTMQLMFAEPAAAISKNAVVIAVGFTPLLFAPLVPYITVGFFLATIMAVSALVTLLMLPAMLTAWRRWTLR